MFDWDSVPDDIANYVAVEQLSDDEPNEPLLEDSSTSIARFELQSANLCFDTRLSASISKKPNM